MAKKKTAGTSPADITPPSPAEAAPKRKRAAAPKTKSQPAIAVPDSANDHTSAVSVAEPVVTSSNGGPTREQIAEAAYHRYLKRGGGDGQDFDDWLAAEQELRFR